MNLSLGLPVIFGVLLVAGAIVRNGVSIRGIVRGYLKAVRNPSGQSAWMDYGD